MKLKGFINLHKINLLKFLQSLCRLVGPLSLTLFPAFAEAAPRRQALGERGGPFHGCRRKRDTYPYKKRGTKGVKCVETWIASEGSEMPWKQYVHLRARAFLFANIFFCSTFFIFFFNRLFNFSLRSSSNDINVREGGRWSIFLKKLQTGMLEKSL